jgi:hypothetical protein
MYRTKSLITHTIAAVIALVLFGAFIAFAWTGPTAAPPNSNVSAPINVGTTAQVKNGGISVNSLAVFGNGYTQGNLGIGIVTAAYPLDVVGNIHNTGNMYSAGYFHNSDVNLKSAIATSKGLDIVSKLRGVTFTWKKDGTPSAGVIAQEVEQVLPHAVHTDADGIKSVEYDQIIAPLIEAIKEQQVEIDALKKQVEALKAR